MIWFSSDFHMMHHNVIEYCNRPYSSAGEMSDDIVRRFNEKVTNEDIFYFLGDFQMNMKYLPVFLSQLNFKKMVYIKGNHDKQLTKWLGKLETPREVEILDHTQIQIGKHLVNLSHYPYKGGGDSGYVERYTERRLEDDGTVLLHGHRHSPPEERFRRTSKGTLMIDVGIDAWGYYPVSREEIEAILSRYNV